VRFNNILFIDKRDSILLIINLLAIGISLLISFYCLKPLVHFYSLFEIISLSNIGIPRALSIALSIFVMDLSYYTLHRLHHKVPYLWRLHRLHHSDRKVDALTTVLHHPLEVISNSLLIIMFYVVFDIPVVVITWFAYVMAFHTTFTHTRLVIPERMNSSLRWFIITPNNHRIHHSNNMKEGNLNFGNIFPWWDMLFKTYIYKTNKELVNVNFGIDDKESPKMNTLKNLLINPFI